MGSHLDIDLSPIFFDFGGQNGAKLDGKSIKNVIQKGIQKQMRKSSRLGRLLAASWAHFGHGNRAGVRGGTKAEPPSK